MVKAQAPPTTQPRAAPKPIDSQNPPTDTQDSAESSKPSNNSSMTASGPVDTLPRRVAKRPSWYGSWPRKSAASTKVICETIRGDTFQPLESSSSANLTRLDAVIKRAASIQSINATETHTEAHTEAHTDSHLPQQQLQQLQQLQQNNSRPSSLQEQPDPPLSASSISTREQNPQMTATASQPTTIETQTPLPSAPPLAETDVEPAILPASSTSQQVTTDPTGRSLKSQSESNLRRQDGSVGSLDSTSSDTAAPCEATTNPNLLLPSFSSTYSIKEPPSLISQITNLILRSHKHPPTKHVFRSIDPPARPVRKAISIGVHGLFPAAYLRPMVGQPTGTSLRFATLGAEAIARWTAAHGFADCDIEKVALEGEGKIAERVENLWKLLLNWLDQLKEADLILISCHSQGVPVGPFPDYKSSMGMLMGSAGELWEFSNPESEISQRLEAALRSVLQFGARITFVGSIDDQLVPLESAVYSPAQHPHIYRAVFIDGRLHAPDFIAHLVGFALKLRNLGVSDHGLIRELSVPLAGSLYSGEGHSRLYYDARVYDLALANALETTSAVPGTSCSIGPRGSLAPTNPYTLPWVMRGLLEEDLVKTRLAEETRVLLQQFQAWKPATKALKDVKYRLDAVRSRL
ncbi:hypothetical protein CFO_g3099 [Ceratocystis platani]|uniref:YMC020W-like alpha/beta hydrolase domain-containing protein n=1 Tax=Ceratocystis fimbriata f. sp. platani TaxID=88771 RepID=A0A0F8B3H0_CERFI|nr:hypothetical protein CFO_g3099 [Ceratocystis platani]